MPSRKQRRRRQKLQRHEYEYVVETDEGEVPLEQVRDEDGLDGNRRAARSRPASGPVDRRGRPIEKPTLTRVLRRAAIFGPILALFVFLTAGDRLTTTGVVVNALVLIAFFVPFSYFVDLMVYRLMMRRYQRERAGGR